MSKIIRISNIPKLKEKLLIDAKEIVVVGGCFDILHPGHLAFLKAAKDVGDTLIVFLESDESIRRLKGKDRPIQPQTIRAEALASLSVTDYIVLLKGALSDKEYDELILAIKPAIIATTEGDKAEYHKKRQAELSGSKLLHVIKRLPEYSTTKIVEKVKKL